MKVVFGALSAFKAVFTSLSSFVFEAYLLCLRTASLSAMLVPFGPMADLSMLIKLWFFACSLTLLQAPA